MKLLVMDMQKGRLVAVTAAGFLNSREIQGLHEEYHSQ
jgi:hypothetical protein